jgi:AcrR family transcriptional regulator
MSTAKSPARERLDGDLRRRQILAAATRIISQRGYYGFAIQEVARQCGITNAGLLYYFGSKEQLLIALLEDRDRRDAAAVTSIAGLAGQQTPGAPSLDDVINVLRAIVERNSTQPEFVRLYAILRAEALNRAHPAWQYFVAREAAAFDAVARMIAAHAAEPRSTARQLLAFMGGLEDQWLRAEHAFDLVAAWDSGVARLLPSPDRSR